RAAQHRARHGDRVCRRWRGPRGGDPDGHLRLEASVGGQDDGGRQLMRWLMCALVVGGAVVVGGCDRVSDGPCSKGCAQAAAVCNPKTTVCEKGVSLDMAVAVEAPDMVMTVVHDMTEADGPPPPMCTPSTAATDCADPTKPVCGAGGQCRACTTGDDSVCM